MQTARNRLNGCVACGGPLPAGSSIRRKYCRSACEDWAYYARHPDKKRRLISPAQLEKEVQQRSAPRLAEQANLLARLRAENADLQRRMHTAQAQIAELERQQTERAEERGAVAAMDAENAELRRRWKTVEAQNAALKETQKQNAQLQAQVAAATLDLDRIRDERDDAVACQQRAELAEATSQHLASHYKERYLESVRVGEQANQELAQARQRIEELDADLRATLQRSMNEPAIRRVTTGLAAASSPRADSRLSQMELDRPRPRVPSPLPSWHEETPPVIDLPAQKRREDQQWLTVLEAMLPPNATREWIQRELIRNSLPSNELTIQRLLAIAATRGSSSALASPQPTNRMEAPSFPAPNAQPVKSSRAPLPWEFPPEQPGQPPVPKWKCFESFMIQEVRDFSKQTLIDLPTQMYKAGNRTEAAKMRKILTLPDNVQALQELSFLLVLRIICTDAPHRKTEDQKTELSRRVLDDTLEAMTREGNPMTQEIKEAVDTGPEVFLRLTVELVHACQGKALRYGS